MPSARKARHAAQWGLTQPWMSVLAASKALGCSRHGVLSAIAAGDLESQHIAGRTVVSQKSVERLKAKRASAA